MPHIHDSYLDDLNRTRPSFAPAYPRAEAEDRADRWIRYAAWFSLASICPIFVYMIHVQRIERLQSLAQVTTRPKVIAPAAPVPANGRLERGSLGR